MKYNSSDYRQYLKEEMENVEKVYNIYKTDENDKMKYWELKKAIYALSLAVKSQKVNGFLSSSEAQEINDYYWGLLL